MNEDQEEIQERQEGEKQFVLAAYSSDEAWISSSHPNRIHRRLDLPINDEDHDDDRCSDASISLDLTLTMPQDGYPVKDDSILEVDATIARKQSSTTTSTTTTSATKNNMAYRKVALDVIPLLVDTCRETAKECAGQESVFAVLSRADEWVDQEWQALSTSHLSENNSQNSTNKVLNDGTTRGNQSEELILGRRLIYSHHIIAKSKRKNLIDLSHSLSLGGYVKIGWPGIIIIEGLNENCIEFIHEIKSWRWQYLVVRGEETEHINVVEQKGDEMNELDKRRKFANTYMEELGEDQMSHLAEICRTVELEELFMTSMKKYQNENNDIVNQTDVEGTSPEDQMYGTLIHVDHMNDKRAYQKWIQKSCDQIGCSCIIRQCFPNDDESTRPWILVAIWGGKASVKNMMKKWRTSKVDIDSKGKPCHERMMHIIMDDYLCPARSQQESPLISNKGMESKYTIKNLCSLLNSVGGSPWRDAFIDYFMKNDTGR